MSKNNIGTTEISYYHFFFKAVCTVQCKAIELNNQTGGNGAPNNALSATLL